MMKCKGCGVLLQHEDPKKEGYSKNEAELCERCFRIRHYNEYRQVPKSNQDFIPILKDISKTNDLVVLVLDVWMLPQNLELIKKYLSNPILLVLTKRDLLPRSITDKYLLEYMKSYDLSVVDQVMISSVKNTNLDELLEKIKKYQTSKKVYVVGYTNAGKSTMINTLLRHYSDSLEEITTSMLTSTTLNTIEVPFLEDMTLLDTPGLLEEGNYLDLLEGKMIKKVIPKKEIKPITYQIKETQTLQVENLFSLEVVTPTNLTFYLSNTLVIHRFYKTLPEHYHKRTIEISSSNQDLVILGIGFIRILKPCTLILDIPKEVNVYVRPSLIGVSNR